MEPGNGRECKDAESPDWSNAVHEQRQGYVMFCYDEFETHTHAHGNLKDSF